MHLPPRFLTCLRECFDKPSPVLVIGKNGLPPVAATHHMVECAGILNPYFAGHGHTLSQLALPCQNYMTLSLTDPFTGMVSIRKWGFQGARFIAVSRSPRT
jgi:hypothetical protein